MKKILISLLFIFSTSSFGAQLHPYWYDLNYEGGMPKSLDSDELDGLVENLHNLAENSLPSEENKGLGNWKLDSFKTILSLGLSGKIGLKTWGGTKSIELIWKKKEQGVVEEDSHSNPVLMVDESMSVEQLKGEFSKVASYLQENGKIESSETLNESAAPHLENFLEISKNLAYSKEYEWRPSGLRLDLNIGASGSVTSGPFIKAGGDIRVRIEWKRRAKSNKGLVSDLNQKVLKVINDLSVYVTQEADEAARDKGLKLKKVKVGVGFGLKRKFGVISWSGSIVPQVYFSRYKKFESMDKSTPGEIPFLKGFKMSERKMRKALKKAIAYGEHWQEKLDRPKYNKYKWKVHTLKSAYSFSLSGKSGATTISGKPVLELEYTNRSF
jgi:hypothetical protein